MNYKINYLCQHSISHVVQGGPCRRPRPSAGSQQHHPCLLYTFTLYTFIARRRLCHWGCCRRLGSRRPRWGGGLYTFTLSTFNARRRLGRWGLCRHQGSRRPHKGEAPAIGAASSTAAAALPATVDSDVPTAALWNEHKNSLTGGQYLWDTKCGHL